ncbi:helix-hairpin-helix domain-containing protein [Dichotomicrobium thermohalophilum]|uniref:Helix-hairpin-helix DNA-binding protein n=1 Tax=Dichotomicrobium thermohalophilum TaxID=933063 RepID=A0A397Q2J7_9HYPH|nr:helix-hairpin-helix domain-containing protein [Dichotomicrobium thermohalophilum]RIA55730.1 helix-hairpin-helix DNA-binding protein [Dichotomicrobium thermohalophilum]
MSEPSAQGKNDREELRENHAIAARLREYADLLKQQGDDGFRRRAYERAADVIEGLDRSLADILENEGREGLIKLRGIGRGIAGAIAEMIATGHWSQLERLQGELVPEALFQTLPGIGPELAHRLVEEGEVESLEELEHALHFGELDVTGIGPRRKRMLEATLADRLGTRVGRRAGGRAPKPPVEMLLDVDKEYRKRANSGRLRKIAPKRFNPSGEAWLPIMHARRDDWHFTVLYSNTARAHELDKTDDWVVIYYQKDGHPEGQCTVVTETRGPLAGQRVVRGREDETPESGAAA